MQIIDSNEILMKKFLPKSFNNPSGFTLVELLVVISIIAILSVIGITVYSSVQKNARDARRRGDIDSIAMALEVNKKNTGYQVLADNQFAGGKIPATDAQSNAYCGNTVSAAASTGMTASACASGWNAVSAASPVAASDQTTGWTICAWLENGLTGNGTAGAYCKSSTQ